jgi:hypothetical protein
MRNPRLILVSSVTALAVLLAVAVTLLPPGASLAEAGTSPTSFKGKNDGHWRVGINVCRCPVTSSDCTCEVIF